MEKAIEFITSFLSQCSECKWGLQGNCEFLLINKGKPSPENNPYMQDDIMTLTNEQRAFRIAHLRGNPCEEQMVFEQYLRKLDEHLEDARIPSFSSAVLRLIAKIYRLNTLVKRGSDMFYMAFNDITDASIDRCLARIDYHFLEQGVDIESAIKSVSSNYSRREAFEGMYPKLIVENYIRQAIKLEISNLTSRDWDIIQIANDIQDQDNQFEEELVSGNCLGYRGLGFSAIKELRWIFEQDENRQLIESILSEFGYTSVINTFEISELSVDTILQYHPDNHYGVFSRWNEFRDEINDSLMRNLRDPIQAIKYLQDIILSTKEIAQYYYPKVTDENHLEAAALLHFLSSIEVPSYKPIIRIWNEAKAYAYDRYQKEDITFEQYLDILKRAATDKAKEEGKLVGYNEFTILNAMLSNMYMLAVHIAGCLLKNYSSTTVEDLQSLCDVKISSPIDEFDLMLHLQFSQDEIDHCREKMKQIAKRRSESNKVKTGVPNPVPEDDTLMPNEMDKIIRKCTSIYQIIDGSIVFNGKKIKHYAIFLKELYRVVYKVREEHFSMQWKKVPIYPMSDGTIPTPEKLSNGIRNYDANKDVAIMEKYRAALNSALASIIQS